MSEYSEVKKLAVYLWNRYYKKDSPNWEILPDTVGVLTQIDNMLAGIRETEEQQAQTIKELQARIDFRELMTQTQHEEIMRLMTLREELQSKLEAKTGECEALQARVELIENLSVWGWLSAALEDENVCSEMKADINTAFDTLSIPSLQSLSAIRNEAIREGWDMALKHIVREAAKSKTQLSTPFIAFVQNNCKRPQLTEEE